MSATSRFNGDNGEAVRTFPGCGDCRWNLFLSLESVDAANKKKDRKSHNQETDNCIHKHAIVNRNRPGSLSGSRGKVRTRILPSLRTRKKLEKSTLPRRIPIGGIRMSDTSEFTIVPKRHR
jgi:hypothetical protein